MSPGKGPCPHSPRTARTGRKYEPRSSHDWRTVFLRSHERYSGTLNSWTFRAPNSAFFTIWPRAAASKIKRIGKAVAEIRCFTRDGWVYPGVDLDLFRKLKRKRAIKSSGGRPYRITERGLHLVRSEVDNR
ncbi:hypothetical protein SAMCCGM7_Ch1426 [Sinorhizobium americanum CCGM7]|nr:hypothetical protein SAMCCGM7_Ch1426 [Sinorhizobium americanum CCGM7]